MPAHQPGPYQQPTATPDAARAFLTEVEEALAEAARPEKSIPTFYKDNTKPPAIGTTPPVPQPGRPPMSQKAVDLNTTILTSSVFTAALGGSATAILWASGQANTTVIGWICGCVVAVPAVLTIPVLALKSLMKAAKDVAEAAPPVHNHHYNGDVYQDHRSTSSKTTGIVAINRNEFPPAR
ncbi:hypothetical protein [Streptomyces sp. NBC_01483]|uniref:hypothetical protein n=1 Tax=Streptomyces sp. NBC_01483 TaxID=2903883 RepID=UPI002E2F0BCF|nr:hypothetical protein [Streptomyces sp. NBC_01483]